MKITRMIDEGICINHQMHVTVHDFTDTRVLLYVEDLHAGTTSFTHMDINESLPFGEWGTELRVESFTSKGLHRMVTFDILHDPQVRVTRLEAGLMQ